MNQRSTIRLKRFFQLLCACLTLPVALPAADLSSQDDSRALARHFQKPQGDAPRWSEPPVFLPLSGETIVLMGGATVAAMRDDGGWETRLHRQFPGLGLRVRNLGWEADTVYLQRRPQFFYTETGDTREGSVPDQRMRLVPGILLLRFGKMESLDGPGSLEEFTAAYRTLIEALEPFSRRIVLVAPEPFFASGPAADLAAGRNAVLETYVAAIRSLAEDRGYLFADLFHPVLNEPSELMSQTGIELTPRGQERLAMTLADELGMEPAPETMPDLDEAIRRLVVKKEKLWTQYYQPTNWAFLFGDRQHVPSSRDDRDANRRWMVEELEKLPGLIDEADGAIWATVRESNDR